MLSKGTAHVLSYLADRVEGKETVSRFAGEAARRGLPPGYFELHDEVTAASLAHAPAPRASSGAGYSSGASAGAGHGREPETGYRTPAPGHGHASQATGSYGAGTQPPQGARPPAAAPSARTGSGYDDADTYRGAPAAQPASHTPSHGAESVQVLELQRELLALAQQHEELEDQMQAGGMSKPKQYAVKKKLAMVRSKRLRAERALKAAQAM